MKKLFAILLTLCLLCTAAAFAEEAPAWDDMPLVVTLDEDLELTDADFEGDWIVDKIFVNTLYMTLEEAEENGLLIQPFSIADGKIVNIVTDEDGEHEAASEYTLENNQILFTDDSGIEAVIEKLEDGNIVLNLIIKGEGDAVIDITYFMVPAEA